MSTFPASPRLVKAGIVLLDPQSGTVQRVVALQYNPETLTRKLQVRGSGSEAGDRLEALRLTGPPVETITMDAEIDATDQMEFPDQNPSIAEAGIYPVLSALETMVYPTTGQLQDANNLASAGTLEITPAEAPLSLFVWSKNRVMPVRVTSFSWS